MSLSCTRTLRRALTPNIAEVGTVCVNCASTGLCGGCRVTGIPTATDKPDWQSAAGYQPGYQPAPLASRSFHRPKMTTRGPYCRLIGLVLLRLCEACAMQECREIVERGRRADQAGQFQISGAEFERSVGASPPRRAARVRAAKAQCIACQIRA